MGQSVIGFPFDLFGSSGSRAGAELLMDELREILDDNRRERTSTRATAYQGQVQLRELPFETPKDYEDWRARGRRAAKAAWQQGEFLVWLAGNHLGALPLYDELAARDDCLVVQLDAHLDIHHFSSCTKELSHGNFLLHCAGPLPPILNLGHRDLLLEKAYIDKHYQAAIAAEHLHFNPTAVLRQLRTTCRKAERVFIDLDCDVFDPSHFPAVAQPVPFGLSPEVVLRIMDAIWSDRVIGIAISEFHPAHDEHDRSLALLAWLLEWLFLKRADG